jgi:hypothetical protein
MRLAARVLALLLVFGCFPRAASATSIQIGLLSFDTGTSTGTTFDITNFTGGNAFPPDFPVATQLTFTVTSLTATTTGSPLIISSSDFTTVDSAGDVNCTVAGDAGTGGCDFAAYNILSATLTGTLTPTLGLSLSPSGSADIENTFTVTITPSGGAFLSGGDTAVINATILQAAPVAVPEPPTAILFEVGMIGLLARYKLNQASQLLKRLRKFRV